jgi:hypothetical protein
MATASGSGGVDTTAAFMETYGKLKKELLEAHASEFTDESSLQWIDRVTCSLSAPLSFAVGGVLAA